MLGVKHQSAVPLGKSLLRLWGLLTRWVGKLAGDGSGPCDTPCAARASPAGASPAGSPLPPCAGPGLRLQVGHLPLLLTTKTSHSSLRQSRLPIRMAQEPQLGKLSDPKAAKTDGGANVFPFTENAFCGIRSGLSCLQWWEVPTGGRAPLWQRSGPALRRVASPPDLPGCPSGKLASRMLL